MNNAAALSAVYHSLAHYRRRQAHAPTDHSAREIVQMSMLAEYLYDTHTHHDAESEPDAFASAPVGVAA